MSLFADDKYKQYPDFQIPPEYETRSDYLPVSYLESYTVKDTNKILSKEERAKLGYLIVVSSQVSIKKYQQTYFLRTDTEIFKLIKSNFPDVEKLCWEGGALVPLDALEKYFKKLPEVKELMNSK